jgi:hypothetical protein
MWDSPLANTASCAGRLETKICCCRGSLRPHLVAKGEAASDALRKKNSFFEGKHLLALRKKNNTQERKRSVFAWKHDFSPVASAMPVEKQFFAGD